MKRKVVEVRQNVGFKREFKKAPRKIQQAFQRRMILFLTNQLHPLLRNHLLSGPYKGYRSINVTGDWRALYKEVVIDDESVIVEFHLLGTHSQLYR